MHGSVFASATRDSTKLSPCRASTVETSICVAGASPTWPGSVYACFPSFYFLMALSPLSTSFPFLASSQATSPCPSWRSPCLASERIAGALGGLLASRTLAKLILATALQELYREQNTILDLSCDNSEPYIAINHSPQAISLRHSYLQCHSTYKRR